MRDILNKLNHIVNEISIAKPKYGPGTQFAVSAGSQAGQKLLDLMQQQGFDPTPPLTMQDTSELGEKEILTLPTVVASAGGEGYLFTNSAGQFILITGTSGSIGPMLNVYKGASLDDTGAEVKAGISNRGETSEGILGAAMFAKFTKREPGEEIGTVSTADIENVLDTLKKTGEDQYEVEVEDYDNVHADKVTFVLRLKTAPYNDLMDPSKRELLTSEFSSAAAYVNSSDAERYSRYFYINGKADSIVVMADGVTGEKTQKTDVWVYVTDEDGNPRKLRLNTSLKVGGIAQFGQVGGSTVETQQNLWNYFGVNVDPVLDDFEETVADDPRRAFQQVYEYAANRINDELQNASPQDEAGVINNIAQGITHFATLGDPKVELVDFSDGGFKILRFNNLVKKLQSVDLEASYVDNKKWPEVAIHKRGDPKNRLLTVRMKVENTKSGPYARNYIEKGPLLEQLTQVKKASWNTEPSMDLDKVTQQRSGVKASAPEPEKLGTDKSLGRKRQR